MVSRAVEDIKKYSAAYIVKNVAIVPPPPRAWSPPLAFTILNIASL